MKEKTKSILMAAWNRNKDLCDVLAGCIESREGWDIVGQLWPRPPQWAWKIFQAAWEAEHG